MVSVAVGVISSLIGMIAGSFSIVDLYVQAGGLDAELSIALAVLFLTVACIVAAINYAPRKLLLTTGAALAFILAAFLYEGYSAVREFIESTNLEQQTRQSAFLDGENSVNFSSKKAPKRKTARELAFSCLDTS